MALIACPECSHQVSTKAASCPNCGAPIMGAKETVATGAHLVTTQTTSKSLKTEIMLSSVVFWSGIVWAFSSNAAHDSSSVGVSLSGLSPTLMIVFGLIWYLVTKIRIWWHHE